MKRPLLTRLPLLATLGLALTAGTGCVKRMALNAMADGLSSSSGGTFSSDDDLGLVGDSLPLALKLQEALLAETPNHRGLHVSLCSGFTQYAVVWVLFPADQAKYSDFRTYQAGQDRGRRLLLRARRYGLEGMDVAHPGFSKGILEDPAVALARTRKEDVPQLYWLGASWLAAISVSKQDPEILGQLPAAAAVVKRALELDETWDRGSVHELLVSLEPSLPGPGGADRARAHFERAVALSEGRRASPYVSLATSVYVDKQDRAGFEDLLQKALAVEPFPEERLAHEYAVAKARWLLDHADDLFLGGDIP